MKRFDSNPVIALSNIFITYAILKVFVVIIGLTQWVTHKNICIHENNAIYENINFRVHYALFWGILTIFQLRCNAQTNLNLSCSLSLLGAVGWSQWFIKDWWSREFKKRSQSKWWRMCARKWNPLPPPLSLQCCYPLIDLLLGNQFTMSPLTQSVEVIVDHDQKPLAVSGRGHKLWILTILIRTGLHH